MRGKVGREGCNRGRQEGFSCFALGPLLLLPKASPLLAVVLFLLFLCDWPLAGEGERESESSLLRGIMMAQSGTAGEEEKRTVQIHPDLPPYEIGLLKAGVEGEGPKIEVYASEKNAGKKLVQTIAVNLPAGAKGIVLRFEDFNFDDYLDLEAAVSQQSAGQKRLAAYWLFVPAPGRFKESASLAGLCNPAWDKERKMIHSVCPAEKKKMLLRSYRFEGDELVMVREGRVEVISGAAIFVWIIRPAAKAPAYYEVVDEKGKLLCTTEKKPSGCDPLQTVVIFTVAEESFSPEQMVEHYTDQVLWRGERKSRRWLLDNHRRYLAGIRDYDLAQSGLRQSYDPSGSRAVVEETVDGWLLGKHGEVIEFSIDKRFRLVPEAGEWKIECEEVTEFHHLEGAAGTDTCGLGEEKR